MVLFDIGIIMFLPSLSLEIHEPTTRHLWNVFANIALIIVSVFWVKEKS